MTLFNIQKRSPIFRLESRLSLLFIFLLATAAGAWRFSPWMPKVFFGDDLANLLAYKAGNFASSLSQALGSAYWYKYRPVFATIMWILYGSFGSIIWPYLLVNLLIQGLNATLVFAITRRLSRGNWLVSLAIALAVVTSRFALYQVTQVTGLVEGVALLCFLGMVYCVIRASESEGHALRWSWLAIVSARVARGLYRTLAYAQLTAMTAYHSCTTHLNCKCNGHTYDRVKRPGRAFLTPGARSSSPRPRTEPSARHRNRDSSRRRPAMSTWGESAD